MSVKRAHPFASPEAAADRAADQLLLPQPKAMRQLLGAAAGSMTLEHIPTDLPAVHIEVDQPASKVEHIPVHEILPAEQLQQLHQFEQHAAQEHQVAA